MGGDHLGKAKQMSPQQDTSTGSSTEHHVKSHFREKHLSVVSSAEGNTLPLTTGGQGANSDVGSSTKIVPP